jgi:hypothetical protein
MRLKIHAAVTFFKVVEKGKKIELSSILRFDQKTYFGHTFVLLNSGHHLGATGRKNIS